MRIASPRHSRAIRLGASHALAHRLRGAARAYTDTRRKLRPAFTHAGTGGCSAAHGSRRAAPAPAAAARAAAPAAPGSALAAAASALAITASHLRSHATKHQQRSAGEHRRGCT